MSERFMGGNDFEVDDLAALCMSYDNAPLGLLYGYDVLGKISGTYNADDDIIIGCIDATECIPAGAWVFRDNALMLGCFAQIVRRAA